MAESLYGVKDEQKAAADNAYLVRIHETYI